MIETVILFALPRESRPFLRRLPQTQIVAETPSPAWQCGNLLVIETGIGGDAARPSLDWLDRQPRPARLLFAGFCGALHPTPRLGDIVCPREIVDERGRHFPCAWPEPNGVQAHHHGRLLTTTAIIADPQEKQRLGEKYDALAVDMEAAPVALWCRDRAIPFGCLRAVSDTMDMPLSKDLVRLLGKGPPSAWQALRAIVAHPSLAREFWRLAHATRLAAHRLADALQQIFPGNQHLGF